MRGTRLPSSSCCPRRHEIWEKLTSDPLAPDTVIRDRQFLGKACRGEGGGGGCRQVVASRARCWQVGPVLTSVCSQREAETEGIVARLEQTRCRGALMINYDHQHM
jgi:hypothetical protein